MIRIKNSELKNNSGVTNWWALQVMRDVDIHKATQLEPEFQALSFNQLMKFKRASKAKI